MRASGNAGLGGSQLWLPTARRIAGCHSRVLLVAATMRVAWISSMLEPTGSCTDRFAFNFDPTEEGVNLNGCQAVLVGCTDAGRGSYNPKANIEDGSCVDGCVPALTWADSDGHGCNEYELGSCGFEDSNLRCPHMCSKCQIGQQLGCDGTPGAVEAVSTVDACGVCGGAGGTCASCESTAEHFCAREVGVPAELGVGSASACRDHITNQPASRATAGAVAFSPDDCDRTYTAFAISGFASETA